MSKLLLDYFLPGRKESDVDLVDFLFNSKSPVIVMSGKMVALGNRNGVSDYVRSGAAVADCAFFLRCIILQCAKPERFVLYNILCMNILGVYTCNLLSMSVNSYHVANDAKP